VVVSFDRVNYDELLGQVAKRISDKRVLKLIRAFLNAGVMEGGLVSPSVEGTPQGGPLSPLLSNLVLVELDRELEQRGHRFVRYADDCNIYVRTARAGQRVMESMTQFITKKLKLKVNGEKSAVARPQERKFLGFSFTGHAEPKRRIAPKAVKRFKQRVRGSRAGAKGAGMKERIAACARARRPWTWSPARPSSNCGTSTGTRRSVHGNQCLHDVSPLGTSFNPLPGKLSQMDLMRRQARLAYASPQARRACMDDVAC
jgi:RNA-directed DNA polymerase